MRRFAPIALIVLSIASLTRSPADAAERLCDSSKSDCRAPLLALINAETQGIDIGFWFMEDDRYATALINRWRAGVPVRVMMDTEANVNYPLNATMLKKLRDAGIPMREKSSGGICHWKMMLFAGQNVVEFSSANFSPHAFVPSVPFVDYIDEVIYFSDDPNVVNSFKTKYDDVWTSTSGFSNYANIATPLTRKYPTFPLDPELNFPPFQNFQSRSVSAYNNETVGIDSIMFRMMDRKHIDGLIAALQRGLRVRLLTEPEQYRDTKSLRYWHSWNVDRLYMAGLAAGVEVVRHRKHAGHTHEKATVLHGQKMTIFGSSNWTTSSSNSQLEHNYFTRKLFFYEWFRDNFERKWGNLAGYAETQRFVPLPPPTGPEPKSPANMAEGVSTTVALKWSAGLFAHLYDVYIGTDASAMVRVVNNIELGPSRTATDYKTYTVSGLLPGTLYYWKIISKTAALQSKSGPVWSFRTAGTSGAPAPGGDDAVLYAAKAPVIRGAWSVVADSTAAGGARLSNPDAGAAKALASASPANYFEMTFNAQAGVPYRIWIRGKATANAWANDSIYVQFSDSVTSAGAATYRIGTTSATTVTIEDCSGCGLSGWGWNDNGYGTNVLGPLIYFATSGVHTIRLQLREDGLSIDQVVVSPSTYFNAAPGSTKDDGTKLPESPGR